MKLLTPFILFTLVTNNDVVETLRLALQSDKLGQAYKMASCVDRFLTEENINGNIKGKFLFLYGRINQERSDYFVSLDYFTRSLNLSDNEIDRTDCYLEIGNVLVALEKYSDSLDSYDRALSLLRSIANVENTGPIARLLMSKGHIFLKLGDHQNAIKKYEEALSIFKRKGTNYDLGKCYASLV